MAVRCFRAAPEPKTSEAKADAAVASVAIAPVIDGLDASMQTATIARVADTTLDAGKPDAARPPAHVRQRPGHPAPKPPKKKPKH